jgi:predicted ribosome quality control (RQC) complex YloA/Tae2 family protein
MELTGRDVRALVRAMQPAVGGKIQKVYGTDRFSLVFDLYARDLPYRYFYVELPSLVFMHKIKVEMPAKPTGFAQRVRGQLQGLHITAIEQHERDRIITFSLEGAKRMTLILELFSKGNAIVLDSEGVIRNVLVKESYGSRDVRPGVPYLYPPSLKHESDTIVFDPGKHLVAQVASAGFGGRTAESILSRFVRSVAKARLEDLKDPDGLHAALEAEWNAQRFSIGDDRIVADPDGRAILDVLATIDLDPGLEEHKAPSKKRSETAIEIQSKRAQSLDERRSEDRRRGEMLFEHYALVEEMLSFARSYREEHGSLEGLEAVWPERFVPLVSVVGVSITLDFERFI